MKNRYSADIEYLTIGLDHAKVEVEAFVNLGCPYSKVFFDVADKVLKPYADDGHIKLVIKHVDRTKAQLLRGTIANKYVDHDDRVEGYSTMKELFDTQKSWSGSFRENIDKCENELGLPELIAQYDRGQEVLKELKKHRIIIVTAVFMNNEQAEHYKTTGLSEEEMEDLLKEKIQTILQASILSLF